MQTINRILTGIILILLFAQPGRGADTLRIHLTYKHRLDAAGRTQGYTTINQKFYTPDQVLFREINYDESTSQISGYVFYFNEGGRLVSEEVYSAADSLQYIVRHRYNASGKETGTDRLIPSGGALIPDGRVDKVFGANGQLVQQKEYKGKKLTSAIKYSYDAAGNLARETGKFKPASGKSVKSEKRINVYNPDHLLAEVNVTAKDLKNSAISVREVYTYNENRQVASVTLTGTTYPAGLVKTSRYLPSGAISIYQEADAAGKINLLLQYDYKKHYMDRGTQVSRLGSNP